MLYCDKYKTLGPTYTTYTFKKRMFFNNFIIEIELQYLHLFGSFKVKKYFNIQERLRSTFSGTKISNSFERFDDSTANTKYSYDYSGN